MRSIVFLMVFTLLIVVNPAFPAGTEISQGQAIARVRSILRNNTGRCRINKVNSVRAVRVGGGWRVTARLIMSASGRRLSETAVWIVSERNGAVAQDQLTAEIAIGCP